MAYRGEDLDLRTPQGWGPQGREAAAGNEPNWWTRSTIYKGGRSDPIWIDDNVMACCNHAFDLGTKGIQNTIREADRLGITHAGTGNTLADAAARDYSQPVFP